MNKYPIDDSFAESELQLVDAFIDSKRYDLDTQNLTANICAARTLAKIYDLLNNFTKDNKVELKVGDDK